MPELSTARDFDVTSVGFGDVETSNPGRVSVPFDKPAAVVTGVATVVGDAVDGDREPVPFLTVKPASADRAFFASFEKRILDSALANVKTWFGKGVNAEHVAASFKSFVTGEEVKLRLLPTTQVFDSDGSDIELSEIVSGNFVQLLIEASAVRIGRNEFGSVWTVKQIRKAVKPVCLIRADNIPEGDEEDDWSCFV